MKPFTRKLWSTLPAISGALMLSACGGGDGNGGDAATALASSDPAPNVVPQNFSGTEDSPLTGTVSWLGLAAGGEYQFELVAPPQHGSVQLNAATGEFTYTPAPDYFGADAFNYRITKTTRRPLHGRIAIELSNVNDAPVLAAIDDMMNSAETRDTTYSLPVVDVDGDVLQVNVTADDPAIAAVTGNGTERSIRITPGDRGSTRIRVTVSDGQLTTAERDFAFTVGDVTKARTVLANAASSNAVIMTNRSDAPVVYTLEHNGFPQFQSKAEMVEYVRNMAPLSATEPFEHKLWRFVRDNMYHNVPLNADQWLYDPWAAISSQGWGFCGHAAGVYVMLAREAGYEARVWGLSGHVVPEIRVDGRWQVYDPDLAVFYRTPDGSVAGLSELSADSSLISSPVDPLFEPDAYPYIQMIADFYGTPANNFVGDDTFVTEEDAQFQPVVLPPRAQLQYPGRWSSQVLGVDGDQPYAVRHFLQAMLTVPQDHTGAVTMPWMLWEIRGSGTVRIDGTEHVVGSAELTQLIQRPGRQIAQVEVVAATSPLEFIFFVNAMRYTIEPVNQVNIKGKDVWAIDFDTQPLPESARPDPSLPLQLKKPIP